jgi:hypothetical protein
MIPLVWTIGISKYYIKNQQLKEWCVQCEYMRLWFSYTIGLDQHLRKPNGQSRESSNRGDTKHRTKHKQQKTQHNTEN